MPKKLLFFVVFLAITSTVHAHGADFVINMTENGFEPDYLEIEAGQVVEFVNQKSVPAWPASDIHPTHGIYPEFDSLEGIAPGDEWSFRFEKPGNWTMHNHLDPDETGTILVKGVENQTQNEQTAIEKIANYLANIKLKIRTQYYKLFPKKLDKMLNRANMMEVANDLDLLEDYVRLAGAGRVMDKLLNDSGGGYSLDCHQQAHNTGRVAYKVYGPEVFTYGNSSCHSGFYHGAMEQFLQEEGTFDLAEKIDKICSQFETSYSNFECLHGVGHGVMAYTNYDIHKALETCDLLGNSFGAGSCYGGVFMENIVTAQGWGAIPGHETKWVSDDPHFPCNSLSDDYSLQRECYMMQTSWMLSIFDGDFEKVAQECLKAPGEMVDICFQSYGRDSAGYALRDPEKIMRYCDLVPEEYFRSCLTGSLYVVMDFWGDSLESQASELCDEVEDEANKMSCFMEVGVRVADIYKNDGSAQKRACTSKTPNFSGFCTGDYDPYLFLELQEKLKKN